MKKRSSERRPRRRRRWGRQRRWQRWQVWLWDGSPDRVDAAGRPDDGGDDDVQRQSVTVASDRIRPFMRGHDPVVDSAVGNNGSGGRCARGGGVLARGSDGGPVDGDGASGNTLGGDDRSYGGGTGNDTAAASVMATTTPYTGLPVAVPRKTRRGPKRGARHWASGGSQART